MKNHKFSSLQLYFIIGLLVFGLVTCKKNDDNDNNDDTNPDAVVDIDGNNYNTIIIGSQTWFAENLRVTKYANGDPIPNITDDTQWSNQNSGAYCDYENLSSNGTIYGHLYNWFAVHDSRKLCPEGWHVPSHGEWETLATYLGGTNIAGGKMKETGLDHWNSPNTGATNESGFTGLPGGTRYNSSTFVNIGDNGNWWTSTAETGTKSWRHSLGASTTTLGNNAVDKGHGFTIRCLKD
jgi:uncharacterized protein (TIGR02145 family)